MAWYGAGLWSLGYLALGIGWLAGAGGYPFTPAGARPSGFTLLDGLSQRAGASVITVLAGVGVVVSLSMLAIQVAVRRGALRWLVTAAAALLGAGLAVVLPDYRVIATIAYTPIMLVGVLVGVIEPGAITMVYRWPVTNLIGFTVAGVAFGAAAFGYWRRTGAGCPRCGRDDVVAAWATPARAARWGRCATAIAVAIPVGYAITRVSWALGIPLGVSAAFLASIRSIVYAGASLGAMAIGGAVLTLGLVQRWGEVFPRWLPWLRGRRVPVALAVVPAYAVSVIVASAGLMFIRLTVRGGFDAIVPDAGSQWAAWLPEMFWPLWSIALAAATTAYWLRRRGDCGSCGRGAEPSDGTTVSQRRDASDGRA